MQRYSFFWFLFLFSFFHPFFREHPIETEFVGDVDCAYLIKFFGLREPDVEWFRIEEVQKD